MEKKILAKPSKQRNLTIANTYGPHKSVRYSQLSTMLRFPRKLLNNRKKAEINVTCSVYCVMQVSVLAHRGLRIANKEIECLIQNLLL